MIKYLVDEIFNLDYLKWLFKYNVQKGYYMVKYVFLIGCWIKMFDCFVGMMVLVVLGK